MLQLIRCLLQQYIDDIDSGNSNINKEQQDQLLQFMRRINSDDLSTIQSANYIGVSRATFDNYVKKGLLPNGEKRQGVHGLFWNKYDLDEFKKTRNNKKK